MGKLVSRNTQIDSPPSYHRARQQPDDLPPRSRPLRQTPTKRTSARPQPVKRTMPARPRRLLEPCAATSGTHGSEGGPPQQRGGPARQQITLRPRRDVARGRPPSTHRKRAAGHGNTQKPRRRTAPPQRAPHHQENHPSDLPRPHPSAPTTHYLKRRAAT